MFGSFSQRRRQIQVNCPACGHEQTEPGLAVSSFCRSCGQHFRIEKGVAILPPGIRPSGIVPVSEPEETRSLGLAETIRARTGGSVPTASVDGDASGQTWLKGARDRRQETKREQSTATAGKKNRSKKGGKRDSQPAEPLAAAPSTAPAEDLAGPDADPLANLGKDAQPAEALKHGSMSAMLGGVIERLASGAGPETGESQTFRPKLPPGFQPVEPRRRGAAQTRPVRCFECNHLQLVPLVATSTQCARCSIYISLVDHVITGPWSQNIRTRGNVTVKRRGNVSGCDIACHNLEVEGKINASVDCSGDAVFRNSGRVMGSMHCRHLEVAKKCDVIFPQGVMTESADIEGTVLGNITCSGTIRIHKTGRVEGNATARSVDLKDGGVLSGRMSIQPNIDVTLPEKKGYLRDDD